jgi:hypothetical protein
LRFDENETYIGRRYQCSGAGRSGKVS